MTRIRTHNRRAIRHQRKTLPPNNLTMFTMFTPIDTSAITATAQKILRDLAASFGIPYEQLNADWPHPPPQPLPEGIWEAGGKLFYFCRSCHKVTKLECDLEDYDPDMAYCGGSPRCLP